MQGMSFEQIKFSSLLYVKREVESEKQSAGGTPTRKNRGKIGLVYPRQVWFLYFVSSGGGEITL